MTATVYMVCGVPGAGKTWVCEQLKDQFRYLVRDDDYDHHFERLLKAARENDHAIITEVPFGESGLRAGLRAAGSTVHWVYIVEEPEVLTRRMAMRGKRLPTVGELNRARGQLEKAREEGVFAGSSEAVMQHLKAIPSALLRP